MTYHGPFFSSSRLLALGVVALSGLLSSCASMPDAQAQQTAYSKECKIVLVDSASQEIHGYATLGREKYQANTPTEQDLAVAGVGKAQVFQPQFRTGVREPNTVAQARRDC
jgi:hypothetical protein